MEHSKQHWVPLSYLKAWCDPTTPEKQTPYVWVFPKEGGEGRRKAPQNIFHETDMYTVRDPRGGDHRDLRLERGLSGLEGQFTETLRPKLESHQELTPEEGVLLAIFVAAMQARTRRQRNHHRDQWSGVLDDMNKLHEAMMQKSPAERAQIARLTLPPSGNTPSLGRSEVAALADAPLQHTMLPAIDVISRQLLGMDVAVFSTTDSIGFVTSDAPCVIFDPEACHRPWIYQASGLGWPTVEVTLPLSPRHLLLYNRQGVRGYSPMLPDYLDEMNRRTVAHAGQDFVVFCDETRQIWYAPEPHPRLVQREGSQR